ncbi:hypothetical protein QBC38DRAFT_515710 [Podospora fimiseda]|uniref:Ecp2 effector protein domain-containing protein n=1 Tax=Podospora fimiseda TaxID=252190 RepID=A0AAN7BIS5_9PEZI|nr:hypothetical protein QBC38DRAFT_515710 [Podospora fimiseda]
MRATTTALGIVALLLPVVSAFQVTGNEIEGALYKVYTDASGNEVHELVTNEIFKADTDSVIAAGIAQSSAVSARDVRGILNARADRRLYCGCGILLDRSDCDASVNDLRGQLRSKGTAYVPIGQAYYAVKNSVVSFVCSRKGNSAVTGVSENTFNGLLEQISHYCGPYIAGTYKHGTPINSAAVDVGYMRSGGDFCARAESSPNQNCW